MTEREPNDDYLWDRSGDPDPQIERLEQVLVPFAHDGRPMAPTRPSHRSWWLLATVLAAAAVLVIALSLERGDRSAGQLRLVRMSTDERLFEGSVLTTKTREVLQLEESLSEITVEPGSRLEVRELRRERTRLHLARGQLQAFVAADAKERFFQVGTAATNCVDLGCRYVLRVDQEQNASVHVTMGRVAFQDPGDAEREVYIPAGAVCRATPRGGAGTPRHLDTPDAVQRQLDDYDRSRGPGLRQVREKLVRQILDALSAAGDRRFTLIGWHFLQDPAIEVAEAALQWLKGYASPRGWITEEGRHLTREQRDLWRRELEEDWGW